MGTALEKFQKDAQICSETWAAYIEVLNLLCEIDPSYVNNIKNLSEILAGPSGPNFQSRALLNSRSGMMRLRSAAAASDLEALRSCLFDALRNDIDTAHALLEATPMIWVGESQASHLCRLYLDVYREAPAPEAKAIAMTNLAELMDAHISEGTILQIATASSDGTVPIATGHESSINPALANAVLLASGPLAAAMALEYHRRSALWQLDHRLRAWGKMMADALDESNTVDMRMAAASALLSFANAIRLIRAEEEDAAAPPHPGPPFGSDASFLPFLLALYAALVDDDEEIREVGADAAAQVVVLSSSAAQRRRHKKATALVAVDAPDALLAWLAAHLGHTHEFRAYVACRLVGSGGTSPLVTATDLGVQDLASWPAPAARFAAALRVDESLFAVEAQNLFVDAVRETERWAAVFRALKWEFLEEEDDHDEVAQQEDQHQQQQKQQQGRRRAVVALVGDDALSALRTWAEGALRALAHEQAARRDDGPLGWASHPAAFALCHRVLVCGALLSDLLGRHGDATFAPLLDRIKETGASLRLHGLLLSILLENSKDEAEQQEKR